MRFPAIIFIVLSAGLYGYGAALTVNQAFDRSVPQTKSVVIENKHMRTGKRSGFFFDLAPWGEETWGRTYSTSDSVYDQMRVSGSICATLHAGALGLPWYRLSDRCP